MSKIKGNRCRRRHSIGEWYGVRLDAMSHDERRALAALELASDGTSGKACPFKRGFPCNKKGGVCTLSIYESLGDSPADPVGLPIATCPNRFLEEGTVHQWVSEVLLGTSDPIVLSEIGFLERVRSSGHHRTSGIEHIGRIDNVLVHPERDPMDWCALEMQAVYFSGRKMEHEFSLLSEHAGEGLPFPAAHRRPDWRSSGPKRLLPQLQTKTPTIRTWGKKLAVIIDESFFNSLSGLDREPHLSNAEIAWFVVGYEKTARGWKLTRKDAVYTKLDASVRALTGGVPLSREAFERQIRAKIRLQNKQHPLARTPS